MPVSDVKNWPPELQRFLAENRVFGQSVRVADLQRRWAFARGGEYVHLKHDWFGRSADQMEVISPKSLDPPAGWSSAAKVPVSARRPSAPSRLAMMMVERFTGLIFSEQRKPSISVEADPDTEAFLKAVIDQSKFWSSARLVRSLGGGCGGVAASAHLRNGKFSVDVHPPWQVVPLWEDKRSFTLRALLKQYTFTRQVEETNQQTGETRLVDQEFLYRRYIDDQRDVIFEPTRIKAGKVPEAWRVREEIEHGLGFCPVVWIQNLENPDDFDGDSDCEGAYQTIEALDRMMAQTYKALLVNLDPTPFITTDLAYLESHGGEIKKGSDNAVVLPTLSTFDYKEIAAGGIVVAREFAAQLKQQALDISRCVLIDPTTISGAAQSAKAIEFIYAPMLEKADDLRGQYGNMFVRPILEMFVAIARKVSGLALGQAGDIDHERIQLPPRIFKDKATSHALGVGGRIVLGWGAYFSPTTSDLQGTVVATVTAKAGGLIDAEHATRKVADMFGIDDVDETLRRIDEERLADASAMFPSAGPGAGFPELPGEPPAPTPAPEAPPEEGSPPGGEGGAP